MCKGMREDCGGIRDYMREINQRMDKYHSTLSKQDIQQVVPMELLKSDKAFYDYILESNDE